MKRIGIVGGGLVDWGGGIDLLRLFLGALKAVSSRGSDFKVVLLLPTLARRSNVFVRIHDAVKGGGDRSLIRWLQSTYWELRRPDRRKVERSALLAGLRQVGCPFKVLNYDTVADLTATARNHGVSVLAPSMIDLGRDSAVPWVGYLPDLQHKHLQHLFSADELASRDKSFAAIAGHADALIATSESVKRDLLEFFEVSGPVVSLPFAPPEPSSEHFDVPAVAAKYGISRRYFVICNQFWKHKAHGTAFEALGEIHRDPRFKDVDLVCTGITEDYRDASYFPNLMRRAEELGIKSRLHVLGRIAKHEQLALISGAVALIQPTLFEGTQGGLSVFDAVSLGTVVIASDIPVNTEAKDPLVEFFRAGDPHALALRMQEALGEARERPGYGERRALARQRLQALGAAFLSACELAATRGRSTRRTEQEMRAALDPN